MTPMHYPPGHTTVLPIVRELCRPPLSSPVCSICPSAKLIPFCVAGHDTSPVGLLTPRVVEALVEICAALQPTPLEIASDTNGVTSVAFAQHVNACGFNGRTEALKPVVAALLERPKFADAKANFNDELVAAAGSDGKPALLVVRITLLSPCRLK